MMMMTSTSSQNIEIESFELSMGSEEQLELSGLENEILDQEFTPEDAMSPVSIPAMLCDEKLIEEIQSIPSKMAFKIGDVADLLGIKQYVLRYWETEFDILKPKKASNNQRMYARKDVENAFLIRKLLHRDRFSIEGARNAMKELKAQVRKEKDMSQVINKLEGINERVDDLLLSIRKLKQMFK
jgi:DNA-binding transcriptional MerR regulator